MYPIKKANTVTVIKKLFQEYIPTNRKPAKIICDHGTQFTAKLWFKKLKEENITLIFSSIRHPQRNIVELVHRELSMFRPINTSLNFLVCMKDSITSKNVI